MTNVHQDDDDDEEAEEENDRRGIAQREKEREREKSGIHCPNEWRKEDGNTTSWFSFSFFFLLVSVLIVGLSYETRNVVGRNVFLHQRYISKFPSTVETAYKVTS